MVEKKDKLKLTRVGAVKLKWPLHAIGHKMIANIPLAYPKQTVGEVREDLFSKIKNYETVNYVYVVTKSKRLVGVFSIKEIFRADPGKQIKEVMKKNVVMTHPKTHQEKVAFLALKNNLKAIPVVDHKKEILGVVPSDQILSILDREARRDLLYMAGIVGHDHGAVISSDLSVLKLFGQRLPWIVVGLFGGLFTAMVISRFEGVLEKDLLLASFIPLVAYLANAVGVQTQSLFIRDVATHNNLNMGKYWQKQMGSALLLGLVCSGLVWGLGTIVWGSMMTGLVVGLAILAAIMVASVFALAIPYTLMLLDFDPAMGSGPFSTIIQDLLSVIIYFSIASVLL